MKNKILGVLCFLGAAYCLLVSMFVRGNARCDDGLKNCYEIHYLLSGRSYNYVMLATGLVLVVIGYKCVRRRF